MPKKKENYRKVTEESVRCKVMLKPTEVSFLYGIALGTLTQWRHLNIGPDYCYVRGKVLYWLKDVEDYFEKHRVRCHTWHQRRRE